MMVFSNPIFLIVLMGITMVFSSPNCSLQIDHNPSNFNYETKVVCKVSLDFGQPLQNLYKADFAEELEFKESILPKVSYNSFENFTNLEILHMSNCSIQVIDSGAFNNLPYLQFLYLSNNNISVFNPNILEDSPQLHFLELSNNILKVIHNGSFEKVSVLRYLYLNGNQISTIENNAFKGLSHLETVDLSSNQLTQLSPELFLDCINLKKLLIGENKIENFEQKIYSNEFLTLDLQRNQISSIPQLKRLRDLNLGHNKLEDIKENMLSGTGVSILNFNDNRISIIRKHSFGNLTELTYLNLGRNNIRVIENDAFSGLVSLTTLFLSFNELEHLNAFPKILSLRTLDLSHNKLRHIDSQLVSPLKNLHTLRISYNRFHNFNVVHLYKQFKNLEKLHIEGNQITCSLLVKQIKEIGKNIIHRGEEYLETNIHGIRCHNEHGENQLNFSDFLSDYTTENSENNYELNTAYENLRKFFILIIILLLLPIFANIIFMIKIYFIRTNRFNSEQYSFMNLQLLHSDT